MKVFVFDLLAYDDVRRHASEIWDRVEAGSMPCDRMWPEADLETFRRWMDGGMRP